ncbi:DNA mismatch repair protein MutS [Buchnera aphidicola (Eriosoma grossulariae)]
MLQKKKNSFHTPMIKQYLVFKKKYPNMFLFYQMGDFYELFFDDAIQSSYLLNIKLTKRGYSSINTIPMSGIPCCNVNYYISKLVKLGKSIVICNQIGNKSLQKGLMKRKIVKVITPGTVTDEDFLSENIDNLLAAVYEHKNNFGYATLDLSSGRFYVYEYNTKDALLAGIQSTDPQELLYPENFLHINLIKHRKNLKKCSDSDFEMNLAKKLLNLHFGKKNLSCFGISDNSIVLPAAGCLFIYVKSMHYNHFDHIRSIKMLNNQDYIYMNSTTIKNLELVKNLSGGNSNTLLSVLDRTVTKMGSRMLKRWLYFPIRNRLTIKNRQKIIFVLQKHYYPLQQLLIHIGDLERIVSRLSLRTALPNDWLSLRISLRIIPKIHNLLSDISEKNLNILLSYIGLFPDLILILERSIAEFPSICIREGNVIADKYNLKLDELRQLKKSAKNILINIENQERVKLGISNLKISFNSLIGYYVQISNKYLEFIPSHYVKKQTLKHFTRFTFSELQQFQETFLTADFRAIELETVLYEELFDIIFPYLKELQIAAIYLSELDVLANLSERSIQLNYVCPLITEKNEIILEKSRHPVIEEISQISFIANDVFLSQKKNVMIITGPNMGGKSTYMRQIALIVILSSIGSFVPAKKAKIGIFDKIFTRIGSADNLFRGQSTFMVEMIELSSILNHATDHSLVLIDEIGRGTSNCDGLALAWSCVEYLVTQINSITLFSTHYVELTLLIHKFKTIQNMFFSILKKNDDIVFLYTIQPGISKNSHSLSVAKMSGLPSDVIIRAKKKLKELNSIKLDIQKNNILINFIISLEPENISPRKALDYIYFLKSII